jgi:hypothetical protein
MNSSTQSWTTLAAFVLIACWLLAQPGSAQQSEPGALPPEQNGSSTYQPKFRGDPLAELVHSGTFTKRMVNTDRGDYTASFKGKKDSYILTMTPKNLDAQHRSFYAEDDGKIHGDETKAADGSSPVVK